MSLGTHVGHYGYILFTKLNNDRMEGSTYQPDFNPNSSVDMIFLSFLVMRLIFACLTTCIYIK